MAIGYHLMIAPVYSILWHNAILRVSVGPLAALRNTLQDDVVSFMFFLLVVGMSSPQSEHCHADRDAGRDKQHESQIAVLSFIHNLSVHEVSTDGKGRRGEIDNPVSGGDLSTWCSLVHLPDTTLE